MLNKRGGVAMGKPKYANKEGSFIQETEILDTKSKKKTTLGKYINDIIYKGKDRIRSEMREMAIAAANRLNISEQMLQKKLYHKDTSREWIIAICAAYGINAKLTSEALTMYNHPSLDFEAEREEAIEIFLNHHAGKPSSLKEIDTYLYSRGLQPLQIQRRRSQSPKKVGDSYFRVRNISLRADAGIVDPYNSLETEFYPRHKVYGWMYLDGKQGEQIELSATSDMDPQDDDILGKETTLEDPKYGAFLIELMGKVQKKVQQYDNILFDSRNYRGRFSANLKECSLNAFYEEFNYSCPERSEYYLIKYWNGEYSLSVAHKSMFMQEYLSPEDYFAHYPIGKIHCETYHSIDEIDIILEKKDLTWQEREILKSRQNAFRRLQKLLTEKIDALRERKIFIRNYDYIWDMPYDVLRYYMIEKLFHCEYDSMTDDICGALPEIVAFPDTEKEVLVTFDDIKAGFEYGFHSFEEICEYKRTHDSISDVLK